MNETCGGDDRKSLNEAKEKKKRRGDRTRDLTFKLLCH